ncbi:MAG: hypothetical protein Kow00127_02640 [Bacteroidales bacterium]
MILRFIKTVFSLSLLFFVTSSSFSQNVYTDPLYPIADEAVTVYFDATGTPLENWNGDIYTHTGVTVNGNQWQYVIGSWGNNSTQPKLDALGGNLYSLDLTPTLRDFYGVPSSGDISELCFVFRSEDGQTQTADLFHPVFGDDLEVVIIEPADDNLMVPEGEGIDIHAISPQADTIKLMVNGTPQTSVAGQELEYTYTTTAGPGYWVPQIAVIEALNSDSAVDVSFEFTVIPEPESAELPSGMHDGINYVDDQTVVLSLYAPNKSFVFVLGDFNNWQAGESGYMKRTPDGDRYWIQLDNLEPGEEYAYQYFVDGEVKVGDPYCEKVLDPWNDSYISNSTYPDLKPYPSGMTEGIVSVLQTAQEPYVWQNQNFTPPQVTDLVIYELLIRDFTQQHTFNSLIDTLGYLKELGVNAIELMPVNEFEGNLSWGYNPNYYFAVDKYYGPKNTFKAFVDSCHSVGIAVIVDVVFNHSFGTSPYVMMYWDDANDRPSEDSPFYNPIPKHDFNVGYDFNHESQATKSYVSRALRFWLSEYQIDGYRFDLSKGFTQKNTLGNVGAWGQYDQSRIDILNQYYDTIHNVNPLAYVILEHFADNSEEKVLANDGMLLWGNMNYNYLEASMGWTANSDLSWASYQQRGWNQPHLVAFMESHDEERMMYKNVTWGNTTNPAHNVTDTSVALRRVPLAAAFFFTIPGPKMIWQFEELGYDYSIEYNGRTGPKPIRWDYYSDYRRKLVHDLFREIINLKKEYAAFRTTDYELNVGGAQKQIRLNDDGMNVLVAGNFAVNNASTTLNFQHSGWWYDYFTGDSLFAQTSETVDMLPGEFRIYTDQKLERPEIGLGVGSIEQAQNILSVFPNPAKDQLFVRFKLERPGAVTLRMVNLNGEVESHTKLPRLTSGTHEFFWGPGLNGISMPEPGIYFMIIETDYKREVKKVVVL